MDSAPKWNIQECDCEEVGGSCRLGHDEILRLRAALDKAEGERDEARETLEQARQCIRTGLEFEKGEAARAEKAEAENARLREALVEERRQHEATKRVLANTDVIRALDSIPDEEGPCIASPTQPAPAGECRNPYCDEAALCCKAAKETP